MTNARLRRAPGFAVAPAALAAVAAALVASPGCGSTCASNCPAISFDVIATPGENLDVLTAHWMGTACPAQQPNYCAPDRVNRLACIAISIIGIQPGTCQLDLTFNDGRAPFSVTAEFGPETHQGCCHGFPVLGAPRVTIPPLHPPPGDAAAEGGAGPDASPEMDGGAGADAPSAGPDVGFATDSSNE
ncbi:MAG TPA: hypothetical protein VFH68_26490 [Polyangia bacterium]|nr:hypothetical protein [Polyangia bacterium]